jgi:hypothetical protein
MWLVLLLAQMIVGAYLVRVLLQTPVLARHAPHVGRIVRSDTVLWGTLAVRAVDVAAYTVRLLVAMRLLGVSLPSSSDVVQLAAVGLAASIIPFGRLGFREAAVALFAQRLDVTGAHAEAAWAQLALVESMAEALIILPLGGAGLLWVRGRWRASRPAVRAASGRASAGPPA